MADSTVGKLLHLVAQVIVAVGRCHIGSEDGLYIERIDIRQMFFSQFTVCMNEAALTKDPENS